MNYNNEKNGIRFYNYYFYKLDKPIKIEAYNKKDARNILDNIFSKLPDEYKQSKIVGETVTLPLVGISEKYIGSVKYIWVGESNANGGWLDEYSFLKITNTN